MGFWAALGSGVLTVISFLWSLLVDWLFIFISPIMNLEILWIIIPIYVNWIFTEIFQEKEGTGLGNAVTNAAVMLWVGIDWIRYLLRHISTNDIGFSWILVTKFFLCIVVIFLGLFIVYAGLKGKRWIKYVARVRETSYVLLMFSPVIYGIINLSWNFLLAIIIYFPLFYFLVEMLDRYTPDPKTYQSEGSGSSDRMNMNFR